MIVSDNPSLGIGNLTVNSTVIPKAAPLTSMQRFMKWLLG